MNRLCRPSDWARQRFINTAVVELRQTILFHRKLWEYTVVCEALEDLGVLDGTRTGVGIGTGAEPLCFHFANRAAHVYACDLFGTAANWAEARMNIESAYNQSPFPYARERLEFRNMDMRNLEFPPSFADFIWSCSSVEHVQSVKELMAVFAGMARILTPGGYAAIVTEFNLGTESRYLPDLILFDEAVLRRIESETPLRLSGPLDLSIEDHPCNLPFQADYGIILPTSRHLPHLWVQRGDLLFTSVLLVFKNDPDLGPAQIVARPDPALVENYTSLSMEIRKRTKLEFPPVAHFTQAGEYVPGTRPAVVAGETQSGVLQYGPYAALPSGAYRVRIGLSIDAIFQAIASDFQICTVEIVASSGTQFRTVAQTGITAGIVPIGQELDLTLYFQSSGLELYEFRTTSHGSARVSYYGARLELIDCA